MVISEPVTTRKSITLLTNPPQAKVQDTLDNRWYALADLICVAIACAIWYITRGYSGWWPLLIATLPWPLRIINGRFPLKRTPFDWLFLLFLTTAVVGILTAYDRTAAWSKFWLIIGAILLFYALAGQPYENVWPVWGGLGFFGSIISAYFLLSHNWVAHPANFAVFQEIRQSWISLRPQLSFNPGILQSSTADGLMAMLTPALVAVTLHLVRRSRWPLVVLLILSGFVLTIGLIFSSSRSAWISLAGGFLVWFLWALSCWISRKRYLSRRLAFLSLVLLLILITVALILLYPGGLAGIAQQLPGPSRSNRVALSQDTVNLIRDYVITGAGLASFPGQYSQYSQITPVLLFDHAHNLFLDVALEQGIAGLIMLLAILGMSFWLLSGLEYTIPSVSDNDLLHGSLLAGLAIVALHGLVDDPLYGSSGLLLLFAISGITAATTRFQLSSINVSGFRLSRSVILTTGVLLLGTLATVIFRSSLESTWHANNGAVTMARVELDSDWPTNLWQGDSRAQQLAGAESKFVKALELKENNVSALYRLGLIALARQEFNLAVEFLTEAQRLTPGHRGVQKALGYSALWNGDIETAEKQLSTLPETKYELGNYAGWWQQQGRPELGTRATQLLVTLQDQ